MWDEQTTGERAAGFGGQPHFRISFHRIELGARQVSNGLVVAARLHKLLLGNSQSHVCLFNLSKDSMTYSSIVVPDRSQICPALQQRRPHQFGGEAVVDGTLQHTGLTV